MNSDTQSIPQQPTQDNNEMQSVCERKPIWQAYKELLKKPNITQSEAMVLVEIARMLTYNKQFFATNDFIAKELSKHPKSISRIMKQLSKKNWLMIYTQATIFNQDTSKQNERELRHIKLTPKAEKVFYYQEPKPKAAKPKKPKAAKPKKPQKQKKTRDKRAQPNIDWLDDYQLRLKLDIVEKWDDTEEEQQRKQKILDDFKATNNIN